MFAKVFEHKWVIRFFGIALVLAPFINTLTSVLDIPNINKSFLLDYCLQFFKSAPPSQQILQVSSLAIGALMLRGSISAWKYTLVLLGGYILIQFMQLSGGARDNYTWLFLGTNVLVFFFIADQLVLKPRPAQQPAVATSELLSPSQTATQSIIPAKSSAPISDEAPKAPDISSSVIEMATPNGSVFVSSTNASTSTPPTTTNSATPTSTKTPSFNSTAPTDNTSANEQTSPHAPVLASQLHNVTPITAHQSAKKVLVNFEGFGNWATISDISEAGIKVRAIAPAPPEITARTIELSLSSNVNVRLKFYQQDGAEYSFNFVALSSQDKQSLNQWLLTTAA